MHRDAEALHDFDHVDRIRAPGCADERDQPILPVTALPTAAFCQVDELLQLLESSVVAGMTEDDFPDVQDFALYHLIEYPPIIITICLTRCTGIDERSDLTFFGMSQNIFGSLQRLNLGQILVLF